MVTYDFGEVQQALLQNIVNVQDDVDYYRVDLALWTDTAFTAWADDNAESSDPFIQHLILTYSDYTLALITDFTMIEGKTVSGLGAASGEFNGVCIAPMADGSTGGQCVIRWD